MAIAHDDDLQLVKDVVSPSKNTAIYKLSEVEVRTRKL